MLGQVHIQVKSVRFVFLNAQTSIHYISTAGFVLIANFYHTNLSTVKG